MHNTTTHTGHTGHDHAHTHAHITGRTDDDNRATATAGTYAQGNNTDTHTTGTPYGRDPITTISNKHNAHGNTSKGNRRRKREGKRDRMTTIRRGKRPTGHIRIYI